jgi:hypothetical protein
MWLFGGGFATIETPFVRNAAIRRHMIEDGEEPGLELETEDVFSPQVIRKRLSFYVVWSSMHRKPLAFACGGRPLSGSMRQMEELR